MRYLVIILALLACVTSINAQWWGGDKKIKGNGKNITEKRSVSSYDYVEVSGSMNVQLVQGPEGKLVVEAEENLLKYIITEVNDNGLHIKMKKGFYIQPSLSNKAFKITVPFKEIENVSLQGSGKIYADDIIKADSFSVKLSGSGKIDLELETQKTYASIVESGDVKLKGHTNEIDSKMMGSGDLHASGFKAKEAFATITGSGDISLYVEEFIKARVTGSGDIRYLGNPEREDKKVIGSGDITIR